MTGATREYLFRLRGDSDQLSRSAEAAAQSVDRLAGSTESYAREQAAARAVGDGFIASLQRQAQSIGKTNTELLALRAAELGVADAASPLIAQIEASAAAQDAQTAAAQRAAAAQKALDNIRSAAQAQERQAYQTKQQFIDQLQRESEALGKTRSQLLEQRAAQLGVTAQAAPLIQRLQAGEKAFGGFARGGKLSGQELVQVGYQLNDFAVQVASGQNAIIALVQQGSQLSGTFGGVGNALRALRSLITPTALAVGGLATGVGLLAFAYAQGYKEQAAFENGLRLTGNRAGVTKGQVDEYARSIEAATDVTIAASREALQAVVSSGAFGPGAVQQVAQAAALLAERTGRTADDVVKDFARMRDGVATWASEANRSYNFLTVEQFKYIRTLEQQGKTEEATRETARLLAEQLGRKTPTELGYLDRALVAGKKAWSDFWDAAFNIGRTETIDDKIADAQRQVLLLAERQARAPNALRGQQLAAASQRLGEFEAQRAAERRAAEQQAKDAETNAKAILKEDPQYLDARFALQRAAEQRSSAAAELARTREYEANEEAYAREARSYELYIATRARLERAALDSRLAGINAEIKAEEGRGVKADTPEALQKEARILQLQTQALGVQQERVRLEAQIQRRFGEDPKDKDARIRAAEAEAGEEEARALNARREAAARAAGDLVESNRSISISLIRDARDRGEALIEAERQQLKQRLDLAVLDAGERKLAEDELAKYVLLRQRELTEALKPEWQRMLEAWADVQGNMKRASDDFQTGFLTSSKETFREFVRTGELSVKRFGDLIVNTLADQVFEQQLAPLFGRLGNGLARAIGLGGGTPIDSAAGAAGGAALQAAQASQASAVAAATAATTAQTTATGSLSVATGGQTLQTNQTTGALFALARASEVAAGRLLAISTSGGGGDAGGGLLGDLVGGFASFFTGPSAIASAVSTSALPIGTPLPPLSFGGGRASGGDVGRGRYYEVLERDEPEIYEDRSGRKYLMNPSAGRVTPAMPLSRGERQAVGGVQVVNNVKIENAPQGAQVSQRRNDSGGTDTLIRFKDQIINELTGDVRSGNGPMTAALASIGVGRSAALRP